MQTVVINLTQANAYASGLAEAANALRSGSLVVFPTETVYGVAANAALPEAVSRLRQVKGRADSRPFTVHIGTRSHARRFLTEPSPLFRRLARRGWPGPLTLITEEPAPHSTEAATMCPPEQLANLYDTQRIGIRCPDHDAATRLLSQIEAPVVASSANPSGVNPPLDVREALRSLDGQVEYAIDAGRTRHNSASTIVEVHGNHWNILREGAVDERTIARWAVSEVLFVCTGNSCRSPMAEYLCRLKLAEAMGLQPAELAEAGYTVSSAGTLGHTGAPLSSGAREELARRGIDGNAHQSRALSVEAVHRAQQIYVMTAEHRDAVLDIAPGVAGKTHLLDSDKPIADPIGGSAEQYRTCADQISKALDQRLKELLDEDRDW